MNIIGHQGVRESLRKRAHLRKRAQSYLFFGPAGVGKSLCALEFAASLTGNFEFSPTEGAPHPADVLVIRPETETKREVTKKRKIPAKIIRESLSFLFSYPAAGKARVVIIEDAEYLSEAAGSVLLKTLEEPPSTAYLLLVSGKPGALLPTLLSRMEKIRFSFVKQSDMKEAFTQGFLESGDPALVEFFFSLGRPGLLIRARNDPLFLEYARARLGTLFRLSRLSIKERLDLAEQLALNVPATTEVLEWWLPGLHALALKNLEEQGKPRLFSYLSRVEETLNLMRTTQANPRLLLERLFLALP